MSMPGLRRLDHVGPTVPDLDQAHRRLVVHDLDAAIEHLRVSGVQVLEHPRERVDL
jgi:hypothetical protein